MSEVVVVRRLPTTALGADLNTDLNIKTAGAHVLPNPIRWAETYRRTGSIVVSKR